MLVLKNIKKDYLTGDTVVNALKGIDLQFRKNEFVSILGPSGCGKTTLLNLVGGLDKYTSGDLVIDGTSTKDYTDREWDTYRNNRIGFVFQNYNLIMHLSVLDNVELALTLSGIDSQERKKRAIDSLTKVGLESQIYKKPNQLSGGQMQRVAIARALVNNPDILLADEPTGALDSVTSVQIMDLLKEVASDKLIIMVTHNGDIAKKYSSRIIRFIDGEIVSDTNPYEMPQSEKVEEKTVSQKAEKIKLTKQQKAEKKQEKAKRKLTSMSFLTALKLSFTNLKSKKGRTITTSIAGSIGIIGVALVLAISNGFTIYINQMQTDALSTYPLQVSEHFIDMNVQYESTPKEEAFPSGDEITSQKQSSMSSYLKNNIISQDVINHVEGMDKSLYSAVQYSYGLQMNLAMKQGNDIKILENEKVAFSPMIGDTDFIKTQYDLLSGAYPTDEKEIFLIINKYNQLPESLMSGLGFSSTQKIKFSDIIGLEMKVVHNDNFYSDNGNGTFSAKNDSDSQTVLGAMYSDTRNTNLKIAGILRVKESNTLSTMGTGIYYMQSLTDTIYDEYSTTAVAIAQRQNTTTNVVTGNLFTSPNEIKDTNNPIVLMQVYMTLMTNPGTVFSFTPEEAYKNALSKLGGEKRVTNIDIYPKDFNKKEEIKTYLNTYNNDKADPLKITVVDNAETMTSMMTQLVNVITIALVCFAGVSLIVSSVMIGVITYVSVVERTKEIGILRSIGARKKDISRVFNAETFIIGLLAGLIGVVFTYILSIPVNLIVAGLVDITGIAQLDLVTALILVVVSVGLTMLAGLVPSKLAAKKDPVVALRTE